MSSPCKKVKLTPKKHSQESKVTSTPQKRRREVLSPDISRISSSVSAVSNSRTCLSTVFNGEITSSNSQQSASSGSRSSTPLTTSHINSVKSGAIIVEDYDTYISNFNKINYTGKVWQLHKPLCSGTLYEEILNNPQNVQDIVTDLLLLYSRRPEKAILKLIKLCVDVSGFQNFEISNHYNFQANISKRILELMESDQILLQQKVLINTGMNLLMHSKSNLGKILSMAIFSFLQKLIICAHQRGILYDIFFSKHFFIFVKCMSFSQIRAIRHVGVLFGNKLLTAVVMVYNKIVSDENSSSEMSDNIQFQIREVNHFIEFFYLIFIKNCHLQDKKSISLRIECIYEMSIWIRYFPKIFITQLEAVNYIVKLMLDYSKFVRFAALEILEVLVETPNTLTHLKNSRPDFSEQIGKRFYDTDQRVSIKAIDIYKTLLKCDKSLITPYRFKMLMNLVFNRSYPIARAASSFLIYYLEKSEDNEEMVLLQLAKLSIKPGDAVKQLLVEGCLESCSAIQNWKLYIDILVHGYIELDIKEHLAELFSEAVHQVLIGKATIMRKMSRKVAPVDPEEHKKVAKYLPLFPELLIMHKDYPKIVVEFLKILLCIKEAVLTEVSVNILDKISCVLEKLFDYHNDEILLKKVCETFRYFADVPNHAHEVNSTIENILQKNVNNLIASVTDVNGTPTAAVMKVSVLFEYFNITSKLKWGTLFTDWNDVDETTTEYLLQCCKWYLIWSLKKLGTIENPTTYFAVLIETCKDFINRCFNMLQHLNGQKLHFKTYQCLCDVHINYMEELDELAKSVKQMEQLKFFISEEQLQNILISFLEKHVISNTAMPLCERRSYFVKYIDLIHLTILPVKSAANIFKYYYVYNKEYGPMIESSFSCLAQTDENTLLLVFIYTLTTVYDNILEKYNVIEMTSQEAKDLKLLIKQFLAFKEFKSPNKLTKLTYFAINYSFKDEFRYPFLYFVKYFADLLGYGDERKQVYNFFKEKIPKGAEKNDAILFFGNYLKNSKPDQSFVKRGKGNQKRPEGTRKYTKKIPIEKLKRKDKDDIETEVSEDDLTIHDSSSN